MPSITLSKKRLQKELTTKLDDDQLAHKISFLGTDLEGFDGDDINVEIFPNRPDLLSQQGLNRALKNFIDEAPVKHYKAKKPRKDAKVIIDKSVKDVRPYTACALVSNLKMSDDIIKEIIQMQEKLHVTYGRNRKRCAIGIYPLEAIKLPITYKALPPKDITFHPLEAKKELSALQILSQHPTGKEYAHLLEGKELFPVFMDANNEILSMPPIINSEKTGRVSQSTKEVFVECSGFSYHVVKGALDMIVTSLADMGGEIEEMILKYPGSLGGERSSPVLEPEKIAFEKSYVEGYLGYELSEKKLIQCLKKMGIGCTASKHKGMYIAHVPTFRVDIIHPIDLVEDIAIGYGMENFEEEIPKVATIAHEEGVESFKEKLRDVLVGCSLLEIKNYNISNKDVQSTKILKNPEDESLVMVASPSSREFDTLRKRLIPSALTTLQKNKHHEYPQNLFEIGEVFEQDSDWETGVKEGVTISIALCGEDANYTKVRQVVDELIAAIDLSNSVKEVNDSLFIAGRAGQVIINKQVVGVLGEVNPEILEKFELDMPVAIVELDVNTLFALLNRDVKI